ILVPPGTSQTCLSLVVREILNLPEPPMHANLRGFLIDHVNAIEPLSSRTGSGIGPRRGCSSCGNGAAQICPGPRQITLRGHAISFAGHAVPAKFHPTGDLYEAERDWRHDDRCV